MPDKATLSAAEEDGVIDGAIIGLMIHTQDQRVWSKDEIDREIGDDTTDSLNRLYGAGLIHRLEGFAWATRAALMTNEIVL
jgi:hypothetical protein